jgi:cytidine deaminase
MNQKLKEENEALIGWAKTASNRARIHLSKFPVGAAILMGSGCIYRGCNIEFDNYSNTIHAEEAAIVEMIMSGDTKPIAIAVFTDDEEPWYPCGMCRQSLFELGGPKLRVIACNKKTYKWATMDQLLPGGFRL